MGVYDYEGNSLFVGGTAYSKVNDVTSFGAKADGVTDDASAIQSAIDDVQTGGMIYFPPGTYLLGSAILFYSNQYLKFAPGATLLLGYNSTKPNLLRNYITDDITGYSGTHDVIIDGATFDGNTRSNWNSPTLLGFCHSSNIVVKNCTFKRARGSWHDLEINSSIYVTVINCSFDGSLKAESNGENIQIDKAGSSSVYPWTCNYDGTACKYVEIVGCRFFNNTISPGIGNHSNGAHEFIRLHENIFDGLTSERGAINFRGGGNNVDIYDNTFNGCTIGVGTSGATYYITNNRFVDATTAISGSTSVSHNNMINGSFVS